MIMTEKVWRGGMVGAGAWSGTQLKAWQGVAGASIVALTDRHPRRREPVARRFSIEQQFDDAATMLSQADLDFLDVCTRPYSHASLTRLGADAGLPVLCQKPFCTSLQEAQETVAYCRQRGIPLMVNENFRWQGWYQQARALLDAGRLGRPFLARLMVRSAVTMPHFDHRQAYFAEMPNLVVYEMGTHYLDSFRYLFGEPETVFARLHQISSQVAGEDVQTLTVAYPQMTAHIFHSWASVPVPGIDVPPDHDGGLPPPPRLEIDGTKATLALTADGVMRLVGREADESWPFTREERPRGRVAAQKHFIDCLQGGLPFQTSGAETVKTMALVWAAYRSAQLGRPLSPQELL